MTTLPSPSRDDDDPDDELLPTTKENPSKPTTPGLPVPRHQRQGLVPREERARYKQNKTRWQRGKAKKNRFAEFRNFLLSRCGGGVEGLNSGAGVLDVAGGKGQLGAELCLRAGVRVTVVDPAMAPLSQYQSKLVLAHCSRLFREQQQQDTPLSMSTTSAGDCRGEDDDVVDAGGQSSSSSSSIVRDDSEESSATNDLRAWIHPKVAAEENKAEQLSHLDAVAHRVPLRIVRCLFDESFLSKGEGGSSDASVSVPSVPERADLFARASVVLGLHPDQATEPIVRHCLSRGKPFAVVPCCVFPDANPHRLTHDGKPVRLLPDFIDYLSSLSPDIKREPLGEVPGCNTVLHYNLHLLAGGGGDVDGGEGGPPSIPFQGGSSIAGECSGSSAAAAKGDGGGDGAVLCRPCGVATGGGALVAATDAETGTGSTMGSDVTLSQGGAVNTEISDPPRPAEKARLAEELADATVEKEGKEEGDSSIVAAEVQRLEYCRDAAKASFQRTTLEDIRKHTTSRIDDTATHASAGAVTEDTDGISKEGTSAHTSPLVRWLPLAGAQPSRRKAAEAIRAGDVSVNGVVTTELAYPVRLGHDVITCGGKTMMGPGGDNSIAEKGTNPVHHTHVLINKPAECLSTRNDQRQTKGGGKVRDPRLNVYDIVARQLYPTTSNEPIMPHCVPIGRLDVDTTGLLLMTTDGLLNNALANPLYSVEKVYRATLRDATRPLSDEAIDRLAEGVEMKPGRGKPPVRVRGVAKNFPGRDGTVDLCITGGLKHQVKHMLRLVGRPLAKLHRLSFATLQLDPSSLPEGQCRHLTEGEVNALYELAREKLKAAAEQQLQTKEQETDVPQTTRRRLKRPYASTRDSADLIAPERD